MSQKLSSSKEQKDAETKRRDKKAIEIIGKPYNKCCSLEKAEVRCELEREDQEA